jgi:hypothetical protein
VCQEAGEAAVASKSELSRKCAGRVCPSWPNVRLVLLRLFSLHFVLNLGCHGLCILRPVMAACMLFGGTSADSGYTSSGVPKPKGVMTWLFKTIHLNQILRYSSHVFIAETCVLPIPLVQQLQIHHSASCNSTMGVVGEGNVRIFHEAHSSVPMVLFTSSASPTRQPVGSWLGRRSPCHESRL